MGVVLEDLWPDLAKDPLVMSWTSMAPVGLDMPPVDIHNKTCKISLLPYPYKATIPCFSSFDLFLRFPSIPRGLRQLLETLACSGVIYGYLLGLVAPSHTVHLQPVNKPCISQIDQF